MKNSALIKLIKSHGQISINGNHYDFSLKVKVHCLECPDYYMDEKGQLSYSESSSCNEIFGTLKEPVVFAMRCKNYNYMVIFPKGNLYSSEYSLLISCKNRSSREEACKEILNLVCEALRQRDDVVESFKNATFGSSIEMVPFVLPTLEKPNPILRFHEPTKPGRFIFPPDKANPSDKIYSSKNTLCFYKNIIKEESVIPRDFTHDNQLIY